MFSLIGEWQDTKAVLPEDAVSLPPALRQQLSDLGMDPDVELFLKQKMLKQQAREEKAQKSLKSALLAISCSNQDL